MEIKKRLITEGSTVNAVLINDEGEEYPVFLETLHNTVMFPMILESGYSLVSLPYGFVKDGVRFEDLPVENYTPTDAELDVMYNSIGVKMAYDDIKSHINTEAVVGVKMPEQKITIKTRDELLKYLEATMVANLDEDFLPLNYFVAKEALFSYEEYKAIENKRYVDAISDRRTMSLKKFYNLVHWLQEQGVLGANYTFLDVLDAYFSWGFDGLNFTVINVKHESRPYKLSLNKAQKVPVMKFTQGLLDGTGDMLTSPLERGYVWKLTNGDQQEYIKNAIQKLDPDDTVYVRYQTSGTQDITTLEGIDFNIQYSIDTLLVRFMSYPTIVVKSPVNAASSLDPIFALPTAKEKLYEDGMLHALARLIYDRRRSKVKTSSFEALQIAGANPKTALEYVVTAMSLKASGNPFGKEKSSDDLPDISQKDIDAYVTFGYDPTGEDSKWEEKAGILDDIVDGVFSIDSIGSAKELESGINDEAMYNELYAVHNVLGISIEDMYKKIVEAGPDDKYVVFSNGKLKHRILITESKYVVNGYLMDVQNYDLQGAEDCSFFTHVIRIAREVGVPEAHEHVGIEFFCVNKSLRPVRELLDFLISKYEQKVSMTLSDAQQQAKALRMKHVFALSRYFEIALHGTYTWSKQLGGEVNSATAQQMAQARANLETRIESLISYADSMIYAASTSSLTFNGYCTNAYVTPTRVIPRGDTPIPEIPFQALWHNYASMFPNVFQQLVALGELPPDYEGWETRYSYMAFAEPKFDGLDPSLTQYYVNAMRDLETYPLDKEFLHVTTPCEYMYPGLYGNKDLGDDMKFLETPRTGKPVVRVGAWRNVTLKDFKDFLYPTNRIEQPDQYIRPFRGYDAHGFMMLGVNVFDKVPSEAEDGGVIVHPRSETVYLPKTGETVDFRRLPEKAAGYNFIHAYDRTYLMRDVSGKVWEARI